MTPFRVRARQSIPALRTRAATPRRAFQIGPKIRIGGSIGAIGQNVKNAVTKGVTDIGHGVGAVASNPWVQGLTAAGLALTGVGAPAAAAIMAAERGGGKLLANGGNIGDGIRGGLEGAAMGYGAGKVGDALYGGLGTIGSGSGALGGVPNGAGGLTGLARTLGGKAVSAVGGGEGGVGGAIGDAAAGALGGLTGGVKDLGLAALAAYQIKASADAAKKQGEYSDLAIKQATENWARGEPLRTQGLNGMLMPKKVDLSSTYANAQNPFAKRPVPALVAPHSGRV